MSIGRRLLNLAKTELNSLLDKAAHADDDDGSSERDPDADLYQRYGLDELTDAQLEAEIERRRRARETTARAQAANASAPRAERPQAPRPSRPVNNDAVRRAYAALEVPAGSDFAAVRKAYRTLMRKYHPDRHTQTPGKQKAANELAQKLTDAYRTLEKHLRR